MDLKAFAPRLKEWLESKKDWKPNVKNKALSLIEEGLQTNNTEIAAIAKKFKDEKDAAKILELVRYANVHTQKPLTEDELRFIASHPEIARKIFTMTP